MGRLKKHGGISSRRFSRPGRTSRIRPFPGTPSIIDPRNRKVTCELYGDDKRYLGIWTGTQGDLMSDCCPCPGGACLPACCDLHDF